MSDQQEPDQQDQRRPTTQDHSALVVEVAVSIYQTHSHQGRAYVSPGNAVKIAATIVGMARSDLVQDLVNSAADNPIKASEILNDINKQAAHRVSAVQKENAALFAAALIAKDESVIQKPDATKTG